ncbi:hypothetical protein FACS1894156_9090 [Bacteroidia bacterium]|nr:hypothetical protein FACS1894156_9090 [Bacteroidia bacterium]
MPGAFGAGEARPYTITPMIHNIERAGDIIQLALPISALLYSAAISDWTGVKQLTYSAGSTVAATEILKYTIHEERPFEPEDGRGAINSICQMSSANMKSLQKYVMFWCNIR